MFVSHVLVKCGLVTPQRCGPSWQMAPTTIKQAIAEALDDLSKEDYLKFCDQLRDRREEPRVSRRAVEEKRRWEVAEVLVSTFTESKALQVTLDLLRQINLNEEAATLDLKTKAFADKGEPSSQETLKAAALRSPLQAAPNGGPQMNRQEEVEAKTPDPSQAGDACDEHFLLGRRTILFGKYKGKTFQWLIENDVSYVAYVTAGHQKENKFSVKQNPLTANKDSLLKYAMAYPEVREEVRLQNEKAKKKSVQPGREGAALVGFGVHTLVTLKDLYESKDSKKIRYVNFLRTKKSNKGSKMDTAVRYILQRDKKQATAATVRQSTSSVPQEAFKRWDRTKRVPSASGQPFRKKQRELRLRNKKRFYLKSNQKPNK